MCQCIRRALKKICMTGIDSLSLDVKCEHRASVNILQYTMYDAGVSPIIGRETAVVFRLIHVV